MKLTKGNFGYLKEKRNQILIRTILLFGLSLSIFLLGYLSTKSKENILTVVAVLGMLPASKSLVSLILYTKYKSGSQKIYESIQSHVGDLIVAYELVLTTQEKTYPITAIVAQGNNIVGYTEHEKCEEVGASKHIETMLHQQGHKKTTVKIFKDLDKFNQRIAQLASKELKLESELILLNHADSKNSEDDTRLEQVNSKIDQEKIRSREIELDREQVREIDLEQDIELERDIKLGKNLEIHEKPCNKGSENNTIRTKSQKIIELILQISL